MYKIPKSNNVDAVKWSALKLMVADSAALRAKYRPGSGKELCDAMFAVSFVMAEIENETTSAKLVPSQTLRTKVWQMALARYVQHKIRDA